MMTWRVITMVVAGMLAVGRPGRRPQPGKLERSAGSNRATGAALAYDWGPIGLDAATITHRRATLTRGGLR